MYPDLSYLFHDLLGTARDNWLSIFKTFGFFLLLAFIVAARLLKSELARREKLGQFTPERVTVVPGSGVTVWDYIFNGFFGFVLGYKIPYAIANVEAWKRDPGSVLLSADGWWASGLLVSVIFVAYYVYLARKPVEGEPYEKDIYPKDRVGPITMLAAIGGIFGAKLFAILEYTDRFVADRLGVELSLPAQRTPARRGHPRLRCGILHPTGGSGTPDFHLRNADGFRHRWHPLGAAQTVD